MNSLHKILLVEDDADIANIYSTVLSENGCTVVVARDGNDALTKVAEINPSLILLDIMIPGIDGLEVLRKIRDDPTQQALRPKIIVMTNLDQQEKVEAAKQRGADGYIVKANIVPHELLEIVKQLEISNAAATPTDQPPATPAA